MRWMLQLGQKRLATFGGYLWIDIYVELSIGRLRLLHPLVNGVEVRRLKLHIMLRELVEEAAELTFEAFRTLAFSLLLQHS